MNYLLELVLAGRHLYLCVLLVVNCAQLHCDIEFWLYKMLLLMHWFCAVHNMELL